jgi:NAD-dependent deacetylase
MPLSEMDRSRVEIDPTPDDERAIARVVERMRPARRVLFITGAGLSADSGMPTYRGRDGLYRAQSATPHGVSIEDALSGPMLAARPEITWNYLLELEKATRGVVPNRGHQVIADMDRYFDEVWTITQNVDGLHHRAGSRNVIEIHGDLHRLGCTRCDYGTIVADYAELSLPPRCPACRGILRPAVVLFGEQLPTCKLARFHREFERGFDIVFSVGTSSLFDYIATPVRQARMSRIPTVEINPEPTAITPFVEYKFGGGAADVLDRIWDRFLAWWPWA